MEEVPYILHSFKTVMPTWDRLYAFTYESKHVPDSLRPAWRGALTFMQQELGEGFFKTCGGWHPVYLMMNQGAEGQVNAFIKWVNALRYYKTNATTYPLLLKKLVAKTKVRAEGIPFMEIGMRHTACGFAVEFPLESQDSKNADIELVYKETNEKLYIEVSRIGDTKDRAEDIDQYNKIFNVIQKYGYDLPFAGKIKSLMTDKVLLETANKIVALKYQAWEGKSLAGLIDENIAIAFSTNGSYEQLKEWCIANDVSHGFSGMPLDFNDTGRIIRQQRIHHEAKQIPAAHSGILYFPVQWLYMLKMDKSESIEKFSIALTPHTNIYGMIVTAEVGVGMEPNCYHDFGHIYSVARDEAGICRHVLFIENPGYCGNLSEQVKLSLRKAML